ncbi:MAG: hypothetical protein ACRCX2_04370 [Paraclostridium sp.]
MIKRTERGTLQVNTLELDIFMGELFLNCNTEKEVEFISELITGSLEKTSEERIEELEEQSNE